VAHTIAGGLKWEHGAEPPHFNHCNAGLSKWVLKPKFFYTKNPKPQNSEF